MQMLVRLIASFCLCCALMACTASPPPQTDNFGAPFAADIPGDVRLFIVRRQGCDHFRGEPRGDYAERDKFLDAQITKTCTGTDKDLAALKAKYGDNDAVTALLSEFDEDIEI